MNPKLPRVDLHLMDKIVSQTRLSLFELPDVKIDSSLSPFKDSFSVD